jgi:hypothetical protein
MDCGPLESRLDRLGTLKCASGSALPSGIMALVGGGMPAVEARWFD